MSAIEHPPIALRAPSTGRRLETIAIAIGICLPVPLLAATGLSVPLPNVVERIAAALVPWAEPVAVETPTVRGTIVPTAAEKTPAGVAPAAVQQTTATPTTPAVPRTTAAPAAPVESKRESRPATPTAPTTSAAPTAAPDTVPGEVDRAGTVTPAAGGDAPAPTPRAETPSAPSSTAPPRSEPIPVLPLAPVPAPTQSTPVVVPAAIPTTVTEVVDEVTTVVADPVGTVVADPVGTVITVVQTPLLPGLGRGK